MKDGGMERRQWVLSLRKKNDYNHDGDGVWSSKRAKSEEPIVSGELEEGEKEEDYWSVDQLVDETKEGVKEGVKEGAKTLRINFICDLMFCAYYL